MFLPGWLVPLLGNFSGDGGLNEMSDTQMLLPSQTHSITLQLLCMFAQTFSCRLTLDSVDLSYIFYKKNSSSRTLFLCFFTRLLSEVDLTRLLPNAFLQPCSVSQHFMKSIISRSKFVHGLHNL